MESNLNPQAAPGQPPSKPGERSPSLKRWLIWVLFLLAMTAGLVMPFSTSASARLDEWLHTRRALAAKAVHVAAYAVLAILSGWLQLAARRRWLLVFFIMVHAPITELLQLHMANRNGSLEDVAFDHLGLFLGLVFSWRWWSAP